MRRLLRGNWQKVLAALFWAVALLGYVFYTRSHDLGPTDTLKIATDFVRSSRYGPLLFIGLYTLRPIFLFSAALLTIGAGALFGPWWGMLYSVLGSNMGATLAFFLGHFFGRGLMDTESPGSNLAPYIRRMRERSFETVFLMRLLFLPYDLVNYLAGILRINYRAFIGATILGSIPGTVSFVLFGASSGLDSGKPEFDWRILAASLVIFIVSIGLSRFLRKREDNS